jgi:glyoxylase-like metal-dependent hydrolase (beta-lactamase superfamily II)
MEEPIVIDSRMHGIPGLTACFLLSDSRVLIETGPKSSVRHVLQALEICGQDRLDWIVVTHIHLDHAGAAGTLARRFPEARVAVHPLGAPHLVDPTKLWSSASRIYGVHMEELWGGIDPVPEDRIEVVEDGGWVELAGGRLQAIATPGHAAHHHAYLDSRSGRLFVGDALGVLLPGTGFIRPATPPPEFDLHQAKRSIRRIDELGAGEAWMTHYGLIDRPVPELCREAVAALERWAEWIEEARQESSDLDEVTRFVSHRAHEEAEGRLSPEDLARLEHTTSYRMNVWGYMRYLDRRSTE